jgi:uncharacterized membrane protein YoaT (DUF817 family)
MQSKEKSIKIEEIFKELYYFLKQNFYSAIYWIILIFIILISGLIPSEIISKYDFIFIIVIFLQIFLILFKIETKKEFVVILIFHAIATVMEIFKTSDAIWSWKYPDTQNSFFVLWNIPLFVGFLYSAVWSYISRAQKYLNLEYVNYPKNRYAIILAVLIYLNFFTHHFIYDFRYFLIWFTIFLFYKTSLKFSVYKKNRKISFLLSWVLTAIFVWFAENIATFQKIWLYPNQENWWELVEFSKATSWFLLLIVSFVIISTLNNKIFNIKNK